MKLLTLLIPISCSTLALCGSYYSDSSSQFYPSGRILVTEQAKQVLRRLRSAGTSAKIFRVDRHIAISTTGYLSQSKQVIDAARRVCTDYRRKYSSPIPVESLCDELAQVYHTMTLEGQHQPIGVALVVCGWDEDLGPQVFTVDPEGSSKGWNAVAIGANTNKLMDQLATLIPEEESSQDGTRNAKSFRSVATMWPKFKTHVLEKYFSNKEYSTQSLQGRGSSDELDFATDSTVVDGAEWTTEVYTCLQASTGEVCWTQAALGV